MPIKKDTFSRAVLIVIYNKPIEKSMVYRKFMKFNKEDLLIVYDNSRQVIGNESLKSIGIYKHDPRNLGLYEAYNYAIDVCRKKKIEWVTIFDQDTEIPDDFFDVLSSKIKDLSESVACIVPNVILGNGKSISPGILENQLFMLRKPNMSSTKVAINSGNTIHVSQFDDSCELFTSRYPLDFLDYDFFKKLSEKKLEIEVLPINLIQNLSVSNYSNMSDARFKQFVKYERKFVIEYYHSEILQYYIKLFLRILKLFFKKKQFEKIKIILDAMKGK